MPSSVVSSRASSRASSRSLHDEAIDELLDHITEIGENECSPALFQRLKAENRIWNDLTREEIPDYLPKLLRVYKCDTSFDKCAQPQLLLRWLVDNNDYGEHSLAVLIDGISREGSFEPKQETVTEYIFTYVTCNSSMSMSYEHSIIFDFVLICFKKQIISRTQFFTIANSHDLPQAFQLQFLLAMCSCEELEWNLNFSNVIIDTIIPLCETTEKWEMLLKYLLYLPEIARSIRYVIESEKIQSGFIISRFACTPHLVNPNHIIAAIDIQRFIRGCFDRRRVVVVKNRFYAANQIQRIIRGFVLRKRLLITQKAVVIQKSWRCFHSRKIFKKLKFEKRRDHCVQTIQRYRLVIAAKKIAFATLSSKLRSFAGMIVLNFMRVISARAATFKLLCEGNQYSRIPVGELFWRYKPVLSKIFRLQRYAKVVSATRVIERIRHERTVARAPILIQAAFRRYIAVRRVCRLKQTAHRIRQAAVKIQRVWKGAAARRVWKPKMKQSLKRMNLLQEELRLAELMNARYALDNDMSESEDSSQLDIINDVDKHRCVLQQQQQTYISPTSRLYLSSIRNSSRHARLVPSSFKKTQNYLCDPRLKTPCLGYSHPQLINFTSTPATSVVSANNLTATGISQGLSCGLQLYRYHKKPQKKMLISKVKQPPSGLPQTTNNCIRDWCCSTEVPIPNRSPPIGEVYRKAHQAARPKSQFCKGSTTLFLSKSASILPQVQNIHNLPESKALELIINLR